MSEWEDETARDFGRALFLQRDKFFSVSHEASSDKFVVLSYSGAALALFLFYVTGLLWFADMRGGLLLHKCAG